MVDHCRTFYHFFLCGISRGNVDARKGIPPPPCSRHPIDKMTIYGHFGNRIHPSGQASRAKAGEAPKFIKQHKEMSPIHVPSSLGIFLDVLQLTGAEPGETNRRKERAERRLTQDGQATGTFHGLHPRNRSEKA
jgi:hypothetical protein